MFCSSVYCAKNPIFITVFESLSKHVLNWVNKTNLKLSYLKCIEMTATVKCNAHGALVLDCAHSGLII